MRVDVSYIPKPNSVKTNKFDSEFYCVKLSEAAPVYEEAEPYPPR